MARQFGEEDFLGAGRRMGKIADSLLKEYDAGAGEEVLDMIVRAKALESAMMNQELESFKKQEAMGNLAKIMAGERTVQTSLGVPGFPTGRQRETTLELMRGQGREGGGEIEGGIDAIRKRILENERRKMLLEGGGE